ncbi:MAG: EamA family transporter [Thermodesulfobacteriota bacterium]
MSTSSNKTGPPSSFAIWTAMISVYVVWGSTYLAIRFAIETIPPFLMAGIRFLIAGSILILWRRLRGDSAPSLQQWRSAAIIGIFLLVGGNGGVVWSEQYVPSGVTALLVGSAPLWMVLLDALRPGGRPTGWVSIAGLILGFIGIAILVGPTSPTHSSEKIDLIGASVLILASLFWSIGSLYSRQAVLPPSPLLGTGMEMLTGGGGLFLLGVLTGELKELTITGISAQSLTGFFYLIIFGSWIGFSAYTWLLRAAPTPWVSTYAYINPVVAVILGHLLAAEPLTPRILIAAAIVVGSVALTTVSQQGFFRSK